VVTYQYRGPAPNAHSRAASNGSVSDHSHGAAGAARAPFDERTLDSIFEIGRGNLRATDDLALKALGHAASAGHTTISVQHVLAARKDLWP
jgi:hypothetical protein